MRTLLEIIEDAKDGNMPSHEECYYAMLVYSWMFNFEHRELQELLNSETEIKPFIKKLKADNSFDMFKNALNKSPKDYIGNDDPANPEYQRMRKLGNKLFDKILKESE